MSEILIASTNSHKIREFRGMLEPLGFRVTTPAELGIELQIEETGKTFAENAVLKAESWRDVANRLVLADDSGLMVDALGGEPGIYSTRYGGPGLNDADRVELVLGRMQDVSDRERTARFVAVLAISDPERDTRVFEGIVEGIITRQPRGAGGFGYDPIFFYPAAGKTFAELPPDQKSGVSHRGKAARPAVEYLKSYTSIPMSSFLQGSE